MRAFDNFRIETVAGYDDAKFSELMQDSGIVRNRLKIQAIINNAARVLEIQKEFGSFDAYLWINGIPIEPESMPHDPEIFHKVGIITVTIIPDPESERRTQR